ncbi:hypothetical protein [Actinoplanes sp. NPDC049316]|uniref:hypothetical protein n=1 Tax=Actinoplanes sp. NPDC049316 TaxID=3154727 RepID=UPI003447B040
MRRNSEIRALWLSSILTWSFIAGAAAGLLSWASGANPAAAVLTGAGGFSGATLLLLAIVKFHDTVDR